MKFIDSHAHLDFDHFHGDFEKVLEHANEAGVTKIINIGSDLKQSQASMLLAENFPHIWATVGIHPDMAANLDIDSAISELENMIKSSKKIIGIGECGLDYHYVSMPENEHEEVLVQNKQIELFKRQLDLAQKFHLPVVIHIRNGEDDSAFIEVVNILKDFPNIKGVVHCFTMGQEEAKQLQEFNLKFGFTGIITYKNSQKIQEAVKFLPLEKILIETDCPFLAPQKYRGQRNEPSYVVEVAKKIAEIKEIELEKVALQTTENVVKLFQLEN